MALAIDQFVSRLKGGGARPNLFRVTAQFPASVSGAAATAEKLRFLCKSAQIPGSTLGVIQVPFMGRFAKLPGDRTFEPWTISVLCDNEYDTRKAFVQWSHLMNEHVDNVRTESLETLLVDWKVEHLDKTEKVIETVHLIGCWPSNVGTIELSFDTTDTIEEFPVTLEYQYWTDSVTSTRRTNATSV